MKPSSKKAGGAKKARGAKKNQAKRTQSQRPLNTLKLVVFALAARRRNAGTTRPDTGRPPVGPIAGKIVGHGFGPGGSLLCSMIGEKANDAVDAMEQAIMFDDEDALEDAIKAFEDAWSEGHSSGCWFGYEP